MLSKPACPICGSENSTDAHIYRERPEGEVAFDVFPKGKYFRRYLKCSSCSHHFTDFRFPEKKLYEGDYVQSTYQGIEGIRKTFAKIKSLPPGKSDNTGRVNYIRSFFSSAGHPQGDLPKVLDVGSGLGVFPFAMTDVGFECTALDPDPTAASHMRTDLGLEVLSGDFFQIQANPIYQLITFNKVLEHVPDPISMLRRARVFLSETKKSHVYIELPDAECAARDSYLREEFFIDHLHVFSFASMAIMAEKAGFELVTMDRLREPSGKYTLRGFASPLPGVSS